MMGARRYRNLSIRGVVYATAQEASVALGVAEVTVQRAAQRGTLDRCGLGRVGVEPMPIRVRGVTYSDAAAAAKAVGVKVGAIHQALHRGVLDRVGLKRVPDHTPVPSKPVQIGPLRFASMNAAGAALGFRRGYVSLAYRRNSAHAKQRILAAAMALHARRDARKVRQAEALVGVMS